MAHVHHHQVVQNAEIECHCDCSEDAQKDLTFYAFSAVLGAAVTWLASSATNPLLGGAITALVSMVAFKAMMTLDQKVNIPVQIIVSLLVDIGTSIALSLAFSAAGFPVSISLALMLSAASIASFLAMNAVCGNG